MPKKTDYDYEPEQMPTEALVLSDATIEDELGVKAPVKVIPPFRCLGHDSGSYFFLPKKAGQIVELNASELTSRHLLRLALLPFWEAHYGVPGKAPHWTEAASDLIDKCERIGVFDPARIRGRGAWVDEGRIIFHTGECLVIDDQRVELAELKSHFFYERRRLLDLKQAPPASVGEAKRLLEICAALPWKNPFCAELLAGWCVVAPICGALTWRSHIWLSGSTGSGKSWTMDNIVKPLLGKIVVSVQSNSTEAGIRQTLQSDALPVLFDEAETEDKQGQVRMQQVLDLARQASSEDGAPIAKGSPGGIANLYKVRSCFAFTSIGVAAFKGADLNRLTRMEFVMRSGPVGLAAFDTVVKLWGESFNQPLFCERMRARAMAQAVHIRDNASVFARAIVQRGGLRRLGDQLGCLLAGAYSLQADGPVSEDEALKWVDARDWKSFGVEVSEKDEIQALNELLGAMIDFNRASRSMGEVIKAASELSNKTMAAEAKAALARHGVKVDLENKVILVSNSHSGLRTIFADTAWARKWKDQFMRLPGAVDKDSVRFSGAVHRAVEIPFAVLTGGN
ncbi:MAG: hypothetical protein Q8N51_00165 [Gammaproteobacteria bacterium]|nr:hypothetical protein [Gammaproteobacteria bacterium]